MAYKLIVLDLDGTLTNDNKDITPDTLQTLMQLQQQGVRVALASGRPTQGIVPLAQQLRLAEYGGLILAFNGGRVIDCQSGKILADQPVPNNLLPTIMQAAEDGGHAILSYRGEAIIATSATDEYVLEEARINKMPVEEEKDFLNALPAQVAKCLIVGHPDLLIPTEKALAAKTEGQLSVYRSAPFFLEVVAPGIDKAASLARLLPQLGLTREEMICIGDGFNDISMIEYAGLGIAMANAQEPVKQKADYVTTLDNNHDGVAEALRHAFQLV